MKWGALILAVGALQAFAERFLRAVNMALTGITGAHGSKERFSLPNLSEGLRDMRAVVEELASGGP